MPTSASSRRSAPTLSIYDTTLTDLEEIASQAQSLANNNPTYGEDIALNVGTQTTSYLKSVTVDLNQEINGRYLYSGSRYDYAARSGFVRAAGIHDSRRDSPLPSQIFLAMIRSTSTTHQRAPPLTSRIRPRSIRDMSSNTALPATNRHFSRTHRGIAIFSKPPETQPTPPPIKSICSASLDIAELRRCPRFRRCIRPSPIICTTMTIRKDWRRRPQSRI